MNLFTVALFIETSGKKKEEEKDRKSSECPSMRDIEWSLEHKNISTTALQMVTEAMKLKALASWKKSYDQPRQHIKKQRHYFANKGPSSKSYGFSSSHVWMWELDHKEGWTLKNWCFWTVVLIKTLESPLDWKEIKPVSLYTGRKAEES